MSPTRHSVVARDKADKPDAANGRRILSTPGVCGGVPCLEGTRVPVWVLERARQFNKSLSEFLEDYPFLNEADFRAAWSYADQHADEIQRQIRENEEV